jgi:hypothetical protein
MKEARRTVDDGQNVRMKQPQKVFQALTFVFAMCICGVVAESAQAANHYVRSDAAGSGTGGDWTNAYTVLPVTLTRGDTYYIAGGNYPGYYSFNTPSPDTTVITIKKAIGSDHGTDVGWDPIYGDAQALFKGQLEWNTGYWVLDGQSGGGPARTKDGWTNGFGFKVVEVSGHPALFVNGGGHVTISHVEVQGAGRDGDAFGEGNDALQSFLPSGPVTISHAYLHDMGRTIFYVNGAAANTLTAEYVYSGQHESVANEHSEMTVIHGQASFVLRWSIVTHEEGTGGVIGGDDCNHCLAEIYGNVFFNNGELPAWGTGNNGLFATDSSGISANWRVYNNTFINLPAGLTTFGTLGMQSGHAAANNYFYVSASHDSSTWGTQNFDHFEDSGAATGTNATTGSGNPFANYPGYDFSLLTPTAGGLALPAPYNVDMFGTTRGWNGTWGRGAVEYQPVQSGPTSVPSAPANVRISH